MSNLKNVRIKSGISQSELAKRTGVNLRMLQYYEQGVKNIDGAKIDTLAALSIALDCGITDIMENPETVRKAKI